jgi:hypothetical protein
VTRSPRFLPKGLKMPYTSAVKFYLPVREVHYCRATMTEKTNRAATSLSI